MLFPIADDNSDRRTTPVVNYLFILANVLVFVFLQGFGTNETFTYEFSTVPERIVTGDNRPIPGRVMIQPFTGQAVRAPGIPSTPISVYLTLITAAWRISSATCFFFLSLVTTSKIASVTFVI
jgi:membrane associated rhomboid family serine protease